MSKPGFNLHRKWSLWIVWDESLWLTPEWGPEKLNWVIEKPRTLHSHDLSWWTNSPLTTENSNGWIPPREKSAQGNPFKRLQLVYSREGEWEGRPFISQASLFLHLIRYKHILLVQWEREWRRRKTGLQAIVDHLQLSKNTSIPSYHIQVSAWKAWTPFQLYSMPTSQHDCLTKNTSLSPYSML